LTGQAPQSDASRAQRSSEAFTQGGYAVLRSQDHQLIVDIGPIGDYGHGHADLLSVQCSIFGERCLVDAGTYGYTAEPVWREYFRGTPAHNTITVDGANQAAPRGPFGWHTRPVVTLRDWQSNAAIDLVDAEHDAYPGLTHRRRVIVLKPDVFVIVDDLVGEGDHAFELTFQFAPIEVTLGAAMSARAITPGGRALWVIPVTTTSMKAEIVIGRTSPARGWVSADYGRRAAAPALIYSARSPLPARIVTVLAAQPQPTPTAPPLAPIIEALSAALKDSSCVVSQGF
jgi:hypothetical protein